MATLGLVFKKKIESENEIEYDKLKSKNNYQWK